MADDSTASVKIVADASGIAPGVEAAKSNLSGLSGFVDQLRTQFASFGENIKAAFAETSSGATEAIERVAQLGETVAVTGERFHEMGEKTKEGFLGIHEGVERINEFKRGLQEAFEVYMAFLGVEMFGEMAEHMGEAAEATERLAQRFGITTEQVQGLRGAALATGVGVDNVTKAMTLLDKKFETDPAYFKKLGIDIKAGASQFDILNAVADKFANTADGPNKTAMAFELMGRAGAAAVPLLDQGAEGIQKLTEKAAQYGEVNAEATKSGVELAESVNESKMAWDGLKQTLTEAFAPLLTEIVDGFSNMVRAMTASYEAGGAVKTVFTAMVDVIEGFGEIFNSIGDAVGEIFKQMGFSASDWSTLIKGAIDWVVNQVKLALVAFVEFAASVESDFYTIRGYFYEFEGWISELVATCTLHLDELKITFQSFGSVVQDALTLHWDSIASDWDAGMAKLNDTIRKRGVEIAASAKEAAGKAASQFRLAGAVDTSFDDWKKQFLKPHAKPEKTGVKSEGGGDDTGPDLNKNKEQKEPKGPSQVDQWKSDLADELLDEKNWGADSIQFTLAYWEQKQALTKAGTKEWLEVHKEVQQAQLAAFKEEQADEITTIKQTLATKTALAKDDAEIAKMGVQEKLTAIDEQEKADQIGAVKAAQLRAAANQELLALDRDLEVAEYNLQVAALQQEAALDHQTVERKKQIHDQLIQMQIQQDAALEVIRKKSDQQAVKDTTTTADAIRDKWKGIFTPIAQAWGQSLQGMIQGTQNFRQMMGSIGSAILSQAIGWIEKTVVNFAAGEAGKTAAAGAGAAARTGIEATSSATSIAISATTALKQIAHSAGLAAARVYAAIAQIPVVGPYLAPIAAAAALAAVIKLGSMVFSAEGGEGEVMGDNVPYLLHKREMVLPAKIADWVRGMASAFSNGSIGQAAASGGVAPMSVSPAIVNAIASLSMPTINPISMPSSLVPRPANFNAPAAANSNGGGAGGGMSFHYHDHTERGLTAQQIEENHVAVAKAVKKAHRNGAFAGTKMRPTAPF